MVEDKLEAARQGEQTAIYASLRGVLSSLQEPYNNPYELSESELPARPDVKTTFWATALQSTRHTLLPTDGRRRELSDLHLRDQKIRI